MENTKKLIVNAKKLSKTEAIASTKYQLLRYRDWWNSPEFQIPEQVLAKDKEFLKSVVDRLAH